MKAISTSSNVVYIVHAHVKKALLRPIEEWSGVHFYFLPVIKDALT